ncbi:MAG TPA: SRPBCC domain-containing protein [Candidatus Saccharimonadales bacterium]|nr:SRPBCC domain-containing protein [Candidatus Saccharimonadales bacterium]
MNKNIISVNKETNEFIAERVFDAPRTRLWEAFANPEQLVKWWGPNGWETTIKTFEFQPQGVWLYGMKCVDENQGEFYNQESWGKAIFEEIDEPEKIVYRDSFSDANGTINDSMPTGISTLEFHDEDGKARLVSRTKYDKPEELQTVIDMGMEEGFSQTWDRLAEFVESEK